VTVRLGVGHWQLDSEFEAAGEAQAPPAGRIRSQWPSRTVMVTVTVTVQSLRLARCTVSVTDGHRDRARRLESAVTSQKSQKLTRTVTRRPVPGRGRRRRPGPPTPPPQQQQPPGRSRRSRATTAAATATRRRGGGVRVGDGGNSDNVIPKMCNINNHSV
jgi:hypothetical protein